MEALEAFQARTAAGPFLVWAVDEEAAYLTVGLHMEALMRALEAQGARLLDELVGDEE